MGRTADKIVELVRKSAKKGNADKIVKSVSGKTAKKGNADKIVKSVSGKNAKKGGADKIVKKISILKKTAAADKRRGITSLEALFKNVGIVDSKKQKKVTFKDTPKKGFALSRKEYDRRPGKQLNLKSKKSVRKARKDIEEMKRDIDKLKYIK